MRDRQRPSHTARHSSGDAPRRPFSGGKGKGFGAKKQFRGRGDLGEDAAARTGAEAQGRPFRKPDRFKKDFRERPDRQDRVEVGQDRPRGDPRRGERARDDRRRPERAEFDGERSVRPFDGRPRGKKRFDREPRTDDAPRGRVRSDHGQHRTRDEGRRGEERAERPGALWIYGRHAALAALGNGERRIKRILAADSALDWLNEADVPADRRATIVKTSQFDIDRALHSGAVHQGLAVEVEALPRARLRETCLPDGARRPVVVFDQITDPHNIGAIFRSAAAFGARAVIVQDRRTPPLAGALAKAAAGAVETVPCIEVVNIARALEGLKDLGYFCAGLDGEATAPIAEVPRDRPVALVLGAEGAGLRRLVSETCDGVFRIPLDPAMDSLNVSNAAAVALYEISRTST